MVISSFESGVDPRATAARAKVDSVPARSIRQLARRFFTARTSANRWKEV